MPVQVDYWIDVNIKKYLLYFIYNVSHHAIIKGEAHQI